MQHETKNEHNQIIKTIILLSYPEIKHLDGYQAN